MRVALFGGSFNPPHVCHQLVALWVKATRPVDAVWLVPTYRHAFGKPLETFEARCELVERLLEPLGEWAALSRVEADLGAESRTIDTVEHLRATRPELELSLVVGADILLEAHHWKAWDRLVATTPLHVVGRAGFEVPGRRFALELPEVSSTDLRQRLAAGELDYCRERIPRQVLNLIVERGLYAVPDAVRAAFRAGSTGDG
jgi:nicotinate-nucleotide adenylyltransferase